VPVYLMMLSRYVQNVLVMSNSAGIYDDAIPVCSECASDE